MLTLHILRSAPVAALFLLSACGEPETIVAGGVPQDQAETAALNAAKPVELPPSMTATAKPYRCKDNSVVFIDLFSGDKQATVHRGESTATGVVLKADEAGQPLVADGGWRMVGTGATVELTQPGKGTQSCKA